MTLLSISIDETKIPLERPYEGQWASDATLKQSGVLNIWQPLRDINGLSEAITALHRARNRDFTGKLSPDEQAQRITMIDIARRIIEAERELQLREFARILGLALGK